MVDENTEAKITSEEKVETNVADEKTEELVEETENNTEESSQQEKSTEEDAGATSEETDENTEEVKEKELSEIIETEEAVEALKKKGFDYNELQEEFNQNQDITKETRAKLNEQGITDETIDKFIEGRKAVVDKEINEISEVIGGREQYNTVLEWAAKNLDKTEIASINSVRDTNVIKIILKDLKNRMEDKEGVTPNYIKGGSGSVAQDIFESQEQMYEAIRDPKYKKDPAYRAKVGKQVEASIAAGKLKF